MSLNHMTTPRQTVTTRTGLHLHRGEETPSENTALAQHRSETLCIQLLLRLLTMLLIQTHTHFHYQYFIGVITTIIIVGSCVTEPMYMQQEQVYSLITQISRLLGEQYNAMLLPSRIRLWVKKGIC